jgi:hypothetical protein
MALENAAELSLLDLKPYVRSICPETVRTAEGKIPLTVSLHSALQSVRDKEHPVMLWADAICIDQDKKLEKSIQMRLMRTIF